MTPVATETDVTTDDGAGRVRRLPLVGVVLAGALLLSACGGSPEGDSQASSEEPSASASSSEADAGSVGESSSTGDPSGTPGDDGSSEESSGEPVPASSDGPAENRTVPEAPEVMFEATEDGAEATVQYWWELFAYAQMTGHTEEFASISQDDCETCDASVTNINDVFRGDAWYANVTYDVEDPEALLEGETSATVPIKVTAPPYDAYDQTGEHRKFDGMDSLRWEATLSFSDGSWRVSEMARVETSGEAGNQTN